MFNSITRKKLFHVALLICSVHVNMGDFVEIHSVSRVSKNGNSNQTNESTKDIKTSIPSSSLLETKNEGRSMQSKPIFNFPNIMTRPVNTNNRKEPRFIIYPSFNPNVLAPTTNLNYQKPQFTQNLYPNGPTAQRRFSPSEAYAGTLYKVKHPEKFNGYQYPTPSEKPAPVTSKPVVQPQYLPPQPQYLPPSQQSKFLKPIIVGDLTTPPTPSLTSRISHFLPTTIKYQNDFNHLHNFEKHINTSYLPYELNAVRDAMDSNNLIQEKAISVEEENKSSESSSDLPFEPDSSENFPPNSDSFYKSSPVDHDNVELINSYIPPPSGDHKKVEDDIISDNHENSYLPPNDLHAFPPNTDSIYLPPDMAMKLSLFNSYIPPPSGDSLNNTTIVDLNYLPPTDSLSQQIETPHLNDKPSGPPDMPKMPMPMDNPPPPPSPPMNMDSMYLPPSPPPPPMSMGMDSLDQAPPTGMDMFDPHDHHHHHHHDHHPWDDYVFDDHFHHHHHHEEETTTTTTSAPEEPRVKKYSYYYLGRKLWYIPLYFTFWFCLYVAALIIRSIGRHKVDLPNHYQRSLHDLSHHELVEKINEMTNFAMYQIDDFREKYL